MRPRLLYQKPQVFALVLFPILFATSVALAQSTSFTYQGRLTDGGTSANGNYDLQCALFDSLSGGAQVGSTQTLNTVAVSNGVFTVSLDFGANAFNGASRFLEISARPSGSGSFTLLTPRQQITSTPYAVRSLTSAAADSVPASGVPSGSGNYIQNSTSPQAISNFNITGNGTAGGTLSGNIINASTQLNLQGSRFLHVSGGPGNVALGFQAGLKLIAGSIGNSFVGLQTGQETTNGSENSFYGDAAGIANISGSQNTAIGAAADVGKTLTNATAIGACALVTQSDSLVLGSFRDGRSFCNGEILRETNVGIGTSAPTAKLSIVATGDGARVLQLGTERAWVVRQFGTGAASALELTGDDPNNNNKNFLINTQGFIGIGTTAPTANLSVNGSANKPGGGSWGTFSDERLKKIKGRFTSGLHALMQLQPVRYEYKPDNALKLKSDGQHVGFSAQAVQEVIPEAVTQTDGGYLVVNNDPILWTMLNAIKEQQTQIAQQQEQINQQQNLIKQQRSDTLRQQTQIETLRSRNNAHNARLNRVEIGSKKRTSSARQRRQVP